MASTITEFVNQIDINYPIPGQDNDTQGFRTNFSNLKNALAGAADEITNLQLFADDVAYMAVQNKPNTFTAKNTFTGITDVQGPVYFSKPPVLPQYTISELSTLTNTNTTVGSVVYLLSGHNTMAFFDGTSWYKVTSTPV